MFCYLAKISLVYKDEPFFLHKALLHLKEKIVVFQSLGLLYDLKALTMFCKLFFCVKHTTGQWFCSRAILIFHTIALNRAFYLYFPFPLQRIFGQRDPVFFWSKSFLTVYSILQVCLVRMCARYVPEL